MNELEFIQGCNLPREWEELIHLELLTGCGCGRRLIHNNRLRGGTTAIRILDSDGNFVVAYVLCSECAHASVQR